MERIPQPRRGAALNLRELVTITVQGEVAPPLERSGPWRIGQDGVPRVLPGTGGIVLSHRVGDPCLGIAGDHVEPGVSIRNDRRPGGIGDAANQALQTLACVGNVARIMSGPAAGQRGVVTGKHGGVDTVLVDFPLGVMRRMGIGDRIQVYARGTGLRLVDLPDVRALNCDPRLIARWRLVLERGRLRVPVTHVVPGALLGSGFGRNNAAKGDIDIQIADAAAVRRHRLDRLRFGDLVAITGADTRFGRSLVRGWTTIGVVVHGESTVAGHGPGVTTLLTGPAHRFEPVRTAEANIAHYLGIRPPRPPRPHAWLPRREALERLAAVRVPEPLGGRA
jgi:hypothetical protein